jgi:DNA (cytosine-5)-methyltransferase 1
LPYQGGSYASFLFFDYYDGSVKMIQSESNPTAIDVFSGCGGLTTGLRSAGFQVLAAVENGAAAVASHIENHPDVRMLDLDVRQLNTTKLLSDLEIEKGDLALLAGGSPCQGFSRMRTRNGKNAAEDERNDLVLEFVRLVEELLPKVVMFENVPGLISDQRFAKLGQRLQGKGYTVAYEVLNLENYGIPQRRRRLIVLASRLSPLTIPDSEDAKYTVRQIIGSLPEPHKSDDPIHRSVTVHSEVVMQKIKKIPKNGGSRMDLGEAEQLECHKKTDGFKDVYGRMSWDKVAPTITRFSFNPSKGRYLHPEQDRAISLREAALLQTFPADYQFPLEKYGRAAVASMIGEAVPPRFAEIFGEHIKQHLENY